MNVAIDLRNSLGPSRDQGTRPTCLVFAATAAHEVGRGNPTYLCVEYLYFMGAKRSHGDPKRGLSPRSLRDALESDGQPEETVWPYTLRAPSSSVWAAPSEVGTQVHTAKILFADRTLADIIGLLQSGKPVILGIGLTRGFYTPDSEGRVLPEVGAVETGKHAVLAVGSGEDSTGRYVLVRNSWGKEWGKDGHAWLHEDYIRERLLTTGVIE